MAVAREIVDAISVDWATGRLLCLPARDARMAFRRVMPGWKLVASSIHSSPFASHVAYMRSCIGIRADHSDGSEMCGLANFADV